MVLNHFDEFQSDTETKGGCSQNYLNFCKRLDVKSMCAGLLVPRSQLPWDGEHNVLMVPEETGLSITLFFLADLVFT
jgi:hypothetical protein